MQKVAVVGRKNVVDIFKVVGCESFVAETKQEAIKIIERLIHENFALIFIASSLAGQIRKTIEKHSLGCLPVFSEIPG